MFKKVNVITALLVSLVASTNASAIVYGGVDFPDGAASFADAVVDYSPAINGGQPTAPYRDDFEALRIPDYTSGPGIDYVSLGSGGSITLQFTDNSLTGSGDDGDDLWVFEIGGDIEDTFVEISKNNIDWFNVGKVTGSTQGIDIDLYGFDALDFFSFVRLTDDPNEGNTTGNTVGADIDALGAITSAPPVDIPAVPVPAAFWLFGTALVGFIGISRRRKVA